MTNLPLQTTRLVIRNWANTDRALFHEINSDETVMQYFAQRRDRAESDLLMDRLAAEIERTGLGFFALELRQTGEPIGFAGVMRCRLEPLFPVDMHEIGWRLARRFWGNGYVTEAGHELLRHGFVEHDFPEIVSFAVAGNERSTAVMRRLGMIRDPARDFDHPGVPDTHPHLQRHIFYAMDRKRWADSGRRNPPSQA